MDIKANEKERVIKARYCKMSIRNPVRLFHITSIENLPKILRQGSLLAKNVVAASGVGYKDIAYQNAQGKRANKPLPNPPGGTIHDCVPFYFAPRSPMLNAIQSGKLPNCPNGQQDILHLETTVDAVVANGAPFVFFDRNATLDYSQPYTDLAKLNEVAWHLIHDTPTLDGFCKYFHSTQDRYADRMERRMAEFLVPGLNKIRRIGVIDIIKMHEVNALLAAAGVVLQVDVMTDWYFLGQ